MFQFPRCPSYGYVFTVRCRCITTGGLPHSDIPGSKPACGSPRHFCACPVLLRLGRTAGQPVVPPGASPGRYVRQG